MTKIRGFLHLYIGEEAVAVGAMHGAHARGCDRRDLSRARPRAGARRPDERSDGRDVRQRRRLQPRARRLDASVRCGRPGSTAATPSSAAACRSPWGSALADKMRAAHAVTACFFGDGAVAEGEFHESLNLAALWQLPVLFCCENNRYAMGTAHRALGVADRSVR